MNEITTTNSKLPQQLQQNSQAANLPLEPSSPLRKAGTVSQSQVPENQAATARTTMASAALTDHLTTIAPTMAPIN